MNGKPYLEFREDGTFHVLHITDLQEGVHPKKDTLRLLHALLDTAKPDLVILTGDQLKGYSPAFRLLGKESVQNTLHMLTEPMEKRGIPYAVTFGNHDLQCGLSNEEQAAIYRSYPYCICPAEEQGAGTFYLKIRNSSGAEALRFYLVDSGNKTVHGQYAPPSKEVLMWLKGLLLEDQVPSMVFQHIPLPEYKKCRNVTLKERICSPGKNAGEFALLRDNGQVMAVFCGHDHKNDFVGRVDGIDLGYTPSGGFACYGPGAERGGRLLTFHADRPMHYETKLLRYCDIVAPHTGNQIKEFFDTHTPTCWPGRTELIDEENLENA